jgi:hypothetical protein
MCIGVDPKAATMPRMRVGNVGPPGVEKFCMGSIATFMSQCLQAGLPKSFFHQDLIVIAHLCYFA